MKAIYSKAIKVGIPMGVVIACIYLFLGWYAVSMMGKYLTDTWADSSCCYFMIASTIVYAIGGILAVTYARGGIARMPEAGRIAFVAVATAAVGGGLLAGVVTSFTDIVGSPPCGIGYIVLRILGLPLSFLLESIPGLFLAVQAGMFWYDRLAKKR